jgi:hypothetical protein
MSKAIHRLDKEIKYSTYNDTRHSAASSNDDYKLGIFDQVRNEDQ